MTNQHINIVRITAVANALGKLNESIVFVGGATVSLYCNPELIEDLRPTNDVDVIIELASYKEYSNLDERLREIGFLNDNSSGVICRYIIQGIIVDIMPTNPEVLGFSNRWYLDGFNAAIIYPIDKNTTIKIFSLPFFLASKLEAFKHRGKSFASSSDFEDIIYVLDNGVDVETKLLNAPDNVRKYIREEYNRIKKDKYFEEGIYGHINPRIAAVRSRFIIGLLEKL